MPRTPMLRLRASVKDSSTTLKVSKDISVTQRQLLLGNARDAGGDGVEVAPDEVVRVELDDHVVLWMRADDLVRERGQQTTARGAETAAWVIDTGPRVGAFGDRPAGASRGLLKMGIKVLELLGVDLKGKTAAVLSKAFERRKLQDREPGLYRVDLGDHASAAQALSALENPAQALAAESPVLLFLHGTASNFGGSFGKLWESTEGDNGQATQAARKALKERYGDRVVSFEHRTLTESPITNALALVAQLPKGAQLDLVSHSRGGLLGELLCLAQRSGTEVGLGDKLINSLFTTDAASASQIGLRQLDSEAAKDRDAAYAADAQRLKELLKLLDQKQITVRRFVRVACPARGTTLASGRLDRWLSVLDMLSGHGIFGDVADFALAVVKERTDPRTLPGLEAMMPGSALTRLLHLPGLSTSADLSVIAGDVEGDSTWGKLKLLVVDWFYSSEHDLVVNTGSMAGGLRRPEGGARIRLDKGSDVNHFSYFANRKTVGWLLDGLQRADGSHAGFTALDAAVAQEPRWRAAVARSQDRSAPPRPIAVLVPGTMGSALNAQGERVWLHYWRLLKGRLADIGMGRPDVQAVELLDDFYGPLLQHLTRTHRVEVHPYDWRLSVREAAKGLAERLSRLMDDAERTRQPLHIVAHSMGGLVARAALAEQGPASQVWRRMAQLPGCRLLMLGTPNQGSHEAVRWLTGHNPTQAKLALLDFKHGTHGVIDIVRRFPGLVELLPFSQDPNPYADPALWQRLKADLGAGFPLVDEALLRAAKGTWGFVRAAAPDKNLMVYVAGQARATVIDHEVVDDDEGPGGRKLRWIGTTEGDGTVSWASGRLADVPMYYAPNTGHDELCANEDDRRIFRGYVELLLQGKTDQLPSSPPVARDAGAAPPARFVMPDLPVADDLPDETSLRSAGFGGGRRRRRLPARSATLALSVVHGDLAYASHPVVVGHYMGDTIVSAERSLDKRLQGALTRRLDLGLYPGPVGTHAVFFNERPERKPTGAVVVGLGQVGSLTSGRLETGMRDAMLEHALAAAQRARENQAGGAAAQSYRARFSCLLVGTGANHLNPRDSIEAIVRGALAANRRLEESQLDGVVLIDRLEFVELYEDVAITAARELAAMAATREFEGLVEIPTAGVTEGPGRRRRGHFSADAAWDQRVEIALDEANQRLRFVVTGDRARAEESQATGQLVLADAFCDAACTQTQRNAEVAQTLFEMLLPVGLRESAVDERGIVLLLDSHTARYPWELLEDRWSRSGRPPSLAGGMVRQFKTSEYRERPVYAVGHTAFVVGNPDLQGAEDFADLPGARREGELVAQLLRAQGFGVRESIDKTTSDIVAGLHANAWRLLHLAGHGEHEYVGPQGGKPRSGMVIGKNQFLTPGDVEQLRHVPEMVFINCCHLGKVARKRPAAYNKLAANLGEQFIRMGVRAVICAGWAVDDEAALTFAREFYKEMFAGVRFADAVRRARTAVHEGHPGVNTWGAYQCYGDPSYRLVRTELPTSASTVAPFVSPRELVVELGNLREWCRVQVAERDEASLVAAARERINTLQQRIPAKLAGGADDWMARADVAAELGFAYGELKLFAEAVACFNTALAASAGDCPVRAAEQCANFIVRLAAEEWQQARHKRMSAAKLGQLQTELANRIETAIRELEIINERARTHERFALLGGAAKRLASVHDRPEQRLKALRDMVRYYREALDLKQQDDTYALSNWAVACLLVHKLDPRAAGGGWEDALRTQCREQAEREATREREAQDKHRKPDIWSASGQADLALVQLLLSANDKTDCERFAKQAISAYANALARGASPREASSLREHLDFLAEQTEHWGEPVREALKEVRASL
jgi:CHAT domain-containing protein